MTSPLLALRAAIRAACLADASLAALLGGPGQVLDEPPAGAVPVYPVFGDAQVRDASTSTEPGHEHEIAILVWAAAGSAAGGFRVAERIAAILDDAPLAIDGHRLVRIGVERIDTDRDRDSRLARATVRVRAVTEPQP